jgi:hypothetical protein
VDLALHGPGGRRDDSETLFALTLDYLTDQDDSETSAT